MKSLLKLMFAGLALVTAAVAAEPREGAARNLAWAATTLEKIEKDLGELTREPKGADAVALAAAVAEAHARLAALKTVVATADAESESIGKAADFAKDLASLAQWTIDRAGELAGKRHARRKMFEERAVLTKTDFGKQLDAALLALAGTSLRQAAAQLGAKQSAALAAEAAWNTQALRFDQLMEAADDEANWLDRKAEWLSAISDSGKQIKLTELEAAREKIRAARHALHAVAQEKQQAVNHAAEVNQQIQSLDEKGGQLKEAVDKAHEAFDQAQGRVQEALDE